ncbi:MAG: sugar lactone lactonase YvrE [Saprospiraceae bacterium]|jgi:sugar lactone lactonase YvrE
MKSILKATLLITLIGIAYLFLWPVDLDPAAYTPPPNPGFQGDFAKNNKLAAGELVLKDVGVGPEDIALSPDGLLYTGFADGRIVQFSMEGKLLKEFANTGGRPLGMKFDTSGTLFVVDEEKGLLSIDTLGMITVLATEVAGTKIGYADDLDIAADGTIYFSDATQRSHDIIQEIWELQPTGRLLSYHPTTKETKVEMEGLRFANGVAIGSNDAYLLINETFGMVTHKYWLKGVKKGTSEVWKNDYPGFIDNITYNGNGTFWVAIPNKRIVDFEVLYDKPFWRKVVKRLPESWSGAIEPPPFGMVIGLDLEGEVLYNLQDSTGRISYVTSVNEFDGELWIGSLEMEAVGKYLLKK